MTFRETDIFKRCMAAGIIPESMDDLEKKKLSTTPGKEPGRIRKSEIADNEPVSESDNGLVARSECQWHVVPGLRLGG